MSPPARSSLPLPHCLLGAYAPFVLACGFLVTAGRRRDLVCQPAGGDASTLHYRFLRVERGSLRLESGERLGEGAALLLLPGSSRRLALAPGTRLAHLLFDVVPSPRRRKPDGTIVSTASTAQPPPDEVWGAPLPASLPAAVQQRLALCWPVIRQRYWRDLAGRLQANLLLGDVLATLATATAPAADAVPAGGRDAMRRAVTYGMEAADLVETTVRIRDLARWADWSGGHLRRRFRAGEGMSPREWLIRRRLEAAARRLATGMAVAQAGRESGWRSCTAFINAFRARLGMTPGIWQRRHADGTPPARGGDEAPG